MYPTRLRRRPDLDYAGPHRYSLTFSVHQRRPLFTSAEPVGIVTSQILRAAGTCGVEVMAYCVMPDHLHLVVRTCEESSPLPAFVKKAKQLSGYHGKRACGCPIWQSGYFDRVIGDDDDIRVVVAYVLMNPVRRGLVADLRDYPFSGSSIMTRDELFEYVRDFL